jgi:hypothetical protein
MEINLKLDKEEALILFDFLAKINENDKCKWKHYNRN